jgi:hypothetical protein
MSKLQQQRAMGKIVLVALALLGTAWPLYSQTKDQNQFSKDSIEISNSKLRLGMTKVEVAEKLSDAQFDLKKDNDWLLHNGSLLQFENGKLSFATRDWTLETNDLVDALVRVVSYFNEEGDKACSVFSESVHDPSQGKQVRLERVRIKCGDKTILIGKYTVNGASLNAVTETLGTKSKKPGSVDTGAEMR